MNTLKQFEAFTPSEINFIAEDYTKQLDKLKDHKESSKQVISLAKLLDNFKKENSILGSKSEDDQVKVKFIKMDGDEDSIENVEAKAIKYIDKIDNEIKLIQNIVNKLKEIQTVINPEEISSSVA